MSSFTIFTAAIAGIFSLIIFLRFVLKRKTGDIPEPPRAAGAWPITGHLHLLSGKELPYRIFSSMTTKYGPIFTLKFGVHQALVVNSSEMAKECFTTNDKAFGDRPKSLAIKLLGYNYAGFGFAPYGPYWRALRKIATLELLSQTRQQTLAHVRTSEMKFLVRDVYKSWKGTKGLSEKAIIEMGQWCDNLIFNIILRMISGKRYSPGDKEGDQFKQTMKDFVHLSGTTVVGDVVPWLGWLDFRGLEKKMKITAQKVDGFFEEWLNEQKEKLTSGQHVDPKDQVFMGAMLARLDSEFEKDLTVFDKGTIVKATCSTIIAAGSDTTTMTLTWGLALLVNHPEVLRKAQEEIETHVGKNRVVEESDLKNLVYIQAIVKETMRLYPAAPVIVPHESTEDCIVGGYKIRKGTRLLVNLGKIHRDPKDWPEPEEYRPERFLTTHKDIDINGQSYEYFPFSSGRRICIGVALAFQVLQLALATLIQTFELESPTGEPIDMTESPGLVNAKATPLDVLMSPRLSPKFYEVDGY